MTVAYGWILFSFSLLYIFLKFDKKVKKKPINILYTGMNRKDSNIVQERN